MNKVFVYGTLKSSKILKELFEKKIKKEKAILKDYALYEASDGWFFIKKKTGSFIQGYIIELDDESLKICDAFEYCPTMYERRKVPVSVGNEVKNTYVYYRIDEIKDYKEIFDSNLISKFSEEYVINTEIKNFKEIEHPEFYS